MTIRIRPATAADADAIAAIYAPYVTGTDVTFEETPPDAAEMAGRIAETQRSHPWLVTEREGGTILGYAYARPFHARPGYRLTAETTIYLAQDARGRGVGRRLYATLLDRLAEAGAVIAIGSITDPNPESTRFHAALGFRRVGLLRGVGWKLGAWRDVGYWQRDLAARDGTTPPTTG